MSSKLREVLLKAEVLVSLATFDEGANMDAVEKIRSEIKAAITEPVRNCDVGTAEEQETRYTEYCVKRYIEERKKTLSLCIPKKYRKSQFEWAQMPYEEVK